MRAFLLVTFALMAFPAFAKAESTIKRNCAGANADPVPKSFANFSSEAQRRANPAQYTEKIEKMISDGPYKHLLECRDRMRADPQFKYTLRFLAPNEGRMMSVTTERQYEGMMSKTSVELTFDLKSSPQKIFFVYLHELTHICQTLEWAEIRAKFDIVEALPKTVTSLTLMSPHGQSVRDCRASGETSSPNQISRSFIKDDWYRHRKLGEVQAFYNMTKAYQHYTGVDSSFCRGTGDDGKANLAEGYLEMETMIDQGYFAQDIIVKYQEEDRNKMETAAALFDLGSPQRMYPDRVSRPPLNREMRKLIEGLGLPIVEPKKQ